MQENNIANFTDNQRHAILNVCRCKRSYQYLDIMLMIFK